MPDGRMLAERLKDLPDLPLFSSILAKVGDDNYPDIERAFSVLEALAELDSPASLLADLKTLDLLRHPIQVGADAASNEIDFVRQALRKHLWLPDGLGVGVLDELLGTEYEPPERVSYLSPLAAASVGGTVATLNYDNVFELAGGAVVVSALKGHRILVPEESDGQVRLLKLHGSLSWQRVGDDVIGGGRPLSSEHYDPAVIFGALNKLRHYGPYLDLLRAFSQKLRHVHYVVVIGYGFRDPHINEALRIWAYQPAEDDRPKALIVSLGPDVNRLPTFVEPWRIQNHLTVHLVQQNATETVRMLFD